MGIPPESLQRPTSHGITGMQQRMAPVGGDLLIEPVANGRGTRVRARLRYSQTAALPSAA